MGPVSKYPGKRVLGQSQMSAPIEKMTWGVLLGGHFRVFHVDSRNRLEKILCFKSFWKILLLDANRSHYTKCNLSRSVSEIFNAQLDFPGSFFGMFSSQSMIIDEFEQKNWDNICICIYQLEWSCIFFWVQKWNYL